nr:class I SAM-dependent methyltransferase [Thermococcus sp. M39]
MIVVHQSVKSLYEQKFKKGDYGKSAVFLNPDPHHYHQRILQIVKSINKTKPKLKVLDVGCATGYLSAPIKKFGDNLVYGVEISELAAKEAEKVLDGVIVGNIEEIDLPYPEGYFDVIICSDVLEHLFDPKNTLIRLKRYLNKDGVLLVVLPNVAHYTVRLALLRGKWEYQAHGILDIGHLRFFTKKSAVKMFKEAGYSIEGIIPYTVLPFPLNVLDKMLRRIFTRLFSRFCDTLFAYTYLYVLKPRGK